MVQSKHKAKYFYVSREFKNGKLRTAHKWPRTYLLDDADKPDDTADIDVVLPGGTLDVRLGGDNTEMHKMRHQSSSSCHLNKRVHVLVYLPFRQPFQRTPFTSSPLQLPSALLAPPDTPSPSENLNYILPL